MGMLVPYSLNHHPMHSKMFCHLAPDSPSKLPAYSDNSASSKQEQDFKLYLAAPWTLCLGFYLFICLGVKLAHDEM